MTKFKEVAIATYQETFKRESNEGVKEIQKENVFGLVTGCMYVCTVCYEVILNYSANKSWMKSGL